MCFQNGIVMGIIVQKTIRRTIEQPSVFVFKPRALISVVCKPSAFEVIRTIFSIAACILSGLEMMLEFRDYKPKCHQRQS